MQFQGCRKWTYDELLVGHHPSMELHGASQAFVVAQCDLYCWRVVGRSDCSHLIKSKLINLCVSVYTMGDFVCYLCTISRLPLDGNAQLPETIKGSKSVLEIE